MRLSVAVVISSLGWWLWVGADAGLISSFLPLMEEKKQKKIKASGTPAKLAGYIIYWGESSFVFSFSFS